GDESTPLLFTDVMNCANVRVVQRRSRLSFALEPGKRSRVLRQFSWQKLQSDKAMQARVLGFVDHAHASAAEFLDDAVMRNVFDGDVEVLGGRAVVGWLSTELRGC